MLEPEAVTLKLLLLPSQTTEPCGCALSVAGLLTVRITGLEVTLEAQLLVTIT